MKLGKLRSRIEVLRVEMKILKAIMDRVGAGADALASVEDSLSELMVADIIRSLVERQDCQRRVFLGRP